MADGIIFTHLPFCYTELRISLTFVSAMEIYLKWNYLVSVFNRRQKFAGGFRMSIKFYEIYPLFIKKMYRTSFMAQIVNASQVNFSS